MSPNQKNGLTQVLLLVKGRDCDCCAWCENEKNLIERVGYDIPLSSAININLALMLVTHCH